MSRRRRPRPASAGFDTVRTPFGWRSVPRGRGWKEAAKWAIWRMLSTAALAAAMAFLALVIIARILRHHP